MAVHTLTVATIAPAQEDTARGVLRAYGEYLRGHGGEIVVYRSIYGGEPPGRVLVYLAAHDSATLGTILDRIWADGANNPLTKAAEAAAPPLTITGRITVRSVEPDVAILPPSPVRAVRVYAAGPGRRVEAEQAFREARLRHEGLGVRAAAFLIDYGGTGSGRYAYSIALDSMSALADFNRRNADVTAPPPLLGALDRGAIVQVGARVDRLWDLG